VIGGDAKCGDTSRTRAKAAIQASPTARILWDGWPKAKLSGYDRALCGADRYNVVMAPLARPDLWTLALERQQIDPEELRAAVESEVARSPLDFRTRLLIHDACAALEKTWGTDRIVEWISNVPNREVLLKIRSQPPDQEGFPSLVGRTMEPTRVATVQQFLRELSQSLHEPVAANIGGSIALILQGALSRRTEDIDLVDEVPLQIRTQHDLLNKLAQRYGLRLTHFQSHYLPAGWESRLHHVEDYGNLRVRLVDLYDIFLGKLFSAREKDLDDLRALSPLIDRAVLDRQFIATTDSLRNEPKLIENAAGNWRILFGTQLPR